MVLAQKGADAVGVLLPIPDGVLLRSCEHWQWTGSVSGQRTVGVAVRAKDVAQCLGILGVAFLAGHRVPSAVSARATGLMA